MNELKDERFISLGIPYVDFTGVDASIITSIYESLKIVYERYPLLKNIISSVQTIDSLIDFINNKKIKDGKETITKLGESNNVANYTLFQFQPEEYHVDHFYNPSSKHDNNFYRYYIIAINRGRYKTRTNDFVELYYDKLTIYHELGHVLDTLLHLSIDPDFIELTKRYDTSNLGEYANSNNLEMAAECFAVYMHLQDIDFRIPRGKGILIKAFGKLLNEKYSKLCNDTPIEILNEYYSLNRSFLENENLVSSKKIK